MIDYGKSGRRDSFSFHLVDPFSLQETGETIDVEEGASSITWGFYTDNKCSGSLKMLNSANKDKLVRVNQAIVIGDTRIDVTLGTFFVDSSGTSAKYRRIERDAAIYSTMWRFTQDILVTDFWHPLGTNVVDEIRYLVEVDGGKLSVGEGVNTERTHTRDIWFEIGENRAKVLNTIAGWIDCQVGVDPYGYITLDPYISPANKAVRYTFEAGSNCVYVPGVDISDTSADAVNRVLAYFSRSSKQDDPEKDNYDPYPLTDSVWVDLPEGHKFSYERIGRRRSYVMKLTEPCSHEELTAKAQRYLDENCGSVQYYEIEHVSIPTLRAGDVVRYINDIDYEEPIDCKCLVSEMSMTLKPGAPCKTKLKVVG